MASTPDHPAHDGSDLAALRAQIDDLEHLPSTRDGILNARVQEDVSRPEPTDAAGGDWQQAPPDDQPGDAIPG